MEKIATEIYPPKGQDSLMGTGRFRIDIYRKGHFIYFQVFDVINNPDLTEALFSEELTTDAMDNSALFQTKEYKDRLASIKHLITVHTQKSDPAP